MFKVVFIVSEITTLFLCCLGLLHVALNIDACHFRRSVCPYGNALFEMTWEFALSVVGNLQLSFLSWQDRSLCIRWYCASATCHSLIDYKWSGTDVGECEHTFLYGCALAECSEVVLQGVEFDLCLILLCHGHVKACYKHQEIGRASCRERV